MGASPDFLTARQAAERSGVSLSLLIRWAALGFIPVHLGPDGEQLFKPEDLDALVIRIGQDPTDPERPLET